MVLIMLRQWGRLYFNWRRCCYPKGYQAGGGGNYLYIKHNSVYTTCYMHLKGYAKGIAPGVRVRQKQLIGYVGEPDWHRDRISILGFSKMVRQRSA